MLHPTGRLYEMVNPYEKTVHLERGTDWGHIVVTQPQNFPLDQGYKFEYPAKCFE